MPMRRASKVTIRAGSILLLMIAGLNLLVGGSEYPGLSPAGMRFMLREVLPPLIVAALNLASLDDGVDAHPLRRVLALATTAMLFASSLPRLGAGAAPMSVALSVATGALLVAGVTSVLAERRLPQ
jgi:hypothetical protein